jgi:8-oxo-dGTP pyrophosphatase MutT (NUDIX family)
VRVHHIDVKLPDGQVARDWHLLDYPRQAVGIVPVGADGRILMIDHYRFTTGKRIWETAGGAIDAGETPLAAAHRELLEETGHVAQTMESYGSYFPSCGSSNQVFHVFVATGVYQVGPVLDTNEVIAIRWFTLAEIREMILRNEIIEGLALTGLLWYFMHHGRGPV